MLNLLQLAFGGIVAVLLMASFVTFALIRTNPGKNYIELKLRIQTWWWLVAILFLALTFNRTVAVVLMAIASFMAFKEFLSIAPTRRADSSVLLLAYLSIPLQYLWVGMAWYGMFIIFIPVYVFLLLPMRMVMIGETQGYLRAAGTIQWGLMTTVFSLSHMAYLLELPQRQGTHGMISGEMLVFYLLLLTQGNDIAQYLWGKMLGKNKVIPKVSPNKTAEGLLGGMFTTTVLAWALAPWFTPMSPLHALLSGVLISLFGFIGDVVISAVKRDIGIKDAGSLLPGHGGILDRLDSLTYTAPLFFHFIYYLYY
ncbi:phosphatidate cytidylyltransferase [Janthinobacterium sp. 17J80-10]|uniref:phosphatidate cytidylyltransferase n=1 Tax=Janthinobacterium sp. 17J80-10 TaxID=2497863 RepID=UPI0010052AEC|nr:phosphatidate cytidylyltransferase [Janthinobacterium sp. 17J80-10]QAU33179.1 phosphatidate cytidylyltransferase [Janthinobacterium sp. 17J80-10]